MENSDLVKAVTTITGDVAKLSGNKYDIRQCRQRHLREHRMFASMYPKLFDMCFEPNFNASQFSYMIQQLEDIQKARVSLECGTSNVNTSLTNEYIVPLVGDAKASGSNDGSDFKLIVKRPDGTKTDCTDMLTTHPQ